MKIRLGYDIQFDAVGEVPIVALLNVHPSRRQYLLEPDEVKVEPGIEIENYLDTFGNHASRILAPSGRLRFHNSTLIQDSGLPDEEGFERGRKFRWTRCPPTCCPT